MEVFVMFYFKENVLSIKEVESVAPYRKSFVN